MWRKVFQEKKFTRKRKIKNFGGKKIRAVVDFSSVSSAVDFCPELAELEWKTAGHRTGAPEVEGRVAAMASVAAVHAAAAEEGPENLESTEGWI